MSVSQSVGCICAVAFCLSVSGCSSEIDDGLTKFPVQGQVLINGQPEKGIAVQFHAVNSQYEGNAASPAGVTNEAGQFRLSTNGEYDGAVAGEYIVTFTWVGMNESKSAPTGDRLRGQYSNHADSTFRVNVSEGENNVGPFELTLDSSKPAQAGPSQTTGPLQ